MEPLVTTLIPTYRRPKLLRRAIMSVLSQQGPPCQVCVYDNASGDETEDVVAEIAASDARVRYFRHEKNIGAIANFQFALSRVTTPFFTALSDDDYLLPGFFQSGWTELNNCPQALFWAGLTIRMAPDGRVFAVNGEDWPRDGLYAPPEGLFSMIREGQLCWTGIMFRREVLDQIGSLDLSVGGAADFDFLLRIAARGPFLFSRVPAAVFLLNHESFSETAPFSEFWPGWLKLTSNVAAGEAMTPASRAAAVDILARKGRRMLFRRGLGMLAKRNYPFANNAARVLRSHYGDMMTGAALALLATLCSRSAVAQRLFTFGYRSLERMAVSQRGRLQEKYGRYGSAPETACLAPKD